MAKSSMMFRVAGYVGAVAVMNSMAMGNTRFSDIVYESRLVGDTASHLLKELVNVGLASKNDEGYSLTVWGLRIHADAMDIEAEGGSDAADTEQR